MKMNVDDGNNSNIKKKYVKPILEMIELRSEERIAANSGENCNACQGKSTCSPGGFPGGGQ